MATGTIVAVGRADGGIYVTDLGRRERFVADAHKSMVTQLTIYSGHKILTADGAGKITLTIYDALEVGANAASFYAVQNSAVSLCVFEFEASIRQFSHSPPHLAAALESGGVHPVHNGQITAQM